VSDDDKRRGKAAALAAMKVAYDSEKAGEPGLGGYDRWFAQPNNAALAAIGIYTDRVPAFRELLHEADDDLPRLLRACPGAFPAAASRLAMPSSTRCPRARQAASDVGAARETRRSRLIRNGFCCYNRRASLPHPT
jgi:predicted aminopeptidase